MYQKLKCTEKQYYFKPLSEREQKGVYFCRVIGFDDDLLIWERQIQIACQKNGKYISKKLLQPNENAVQSFFDKTGKFIFDVEKNLISDIVKKWLDFVPQNVQQNIVEAVYCVLLELQMKQNNTNILKNTFVKFMCWLKFDFASILFHLGGQNIPKILYEGDISKYELYLLRVLSLSGCDIVYVHFENEYSYLKIDTEGIFSDAIYGKRKGQPPKHFKEIDLEKLQKQHQTKQNVQEVSELIKTNFAIQQNQQDFFELILKKNNQRGNKNCYYNFFIRYIGIDQKELYQNRLYTFKEDLQQAKKHFLILQEMENPSIQEGNHLRLQKYENKEDMLQQLSEKIILLGNEILQKLFQRAFFVVIEQYQQNSIHKIYNMALKLICWLNRYSSVLFQQFDYDELPLFLYYGKLNESQAVFLNMLSFLPIDVLYVSPQKENDIIFENIQTNSILMELEQNSEYIPFPQKAIKIKQATTAYQAERELDTLLYQDTGLYRQRQFCTSRTVTLKTVYEEIAILWKEEAKYRPNFETKNNIVTIPNIFAKINGVKNGNQSEYFKSIAELLTENTIFIKNFPYIAKAERINTVSQFLKKDTILMDVVKKHKDYPYEHLNLETQNYILQKAQELINLHWIDAEYTEIEKMILYVTLHLDKRTVQLIQQFDFTKELPKVIIVSVNESMATLEDAIYLLFLNLVGFDIVVFTPTGYRNIDKFISKDAFEEYEAGEYLFHMELPERAKLERMSRSLENGLLNRLFKRRK